jgi:hypothetical protein
MEKEATPQIAPKGLAGPNPGAATVPRPRQLLDLPRFALRSE